MSAAPSLPPKRDLFGVGVSVTDYAAVVDACLDLAGRGSGGAVEFMCVHGLVEARHDAAFRDLLNGFEMVCPDGQPVRWALNKFHAANLADRVYGPTTMWKLCEAAAREGVGIYLYGSSPAVIGSLPAKLTAAFPALKIAGAESPPFRPLTDAEHGEAARRINASGAGLVFLGTGCPRQEQFAARHRHAIKGVLLCVGAAFDLHAGVRPMAPAFLQRHGLEWLYRLTQEPGRLWKRYLVYNTQYVGMVARETGETPGRGVAGGGD